MQLRTWKHVGFTSCRCSSENSGAGRLTEGGCGQTCTAGVVLVGGGSNQWWRLDLVHGRPPQRRSNATRTTATADVTTSCINQAHRQQLGDALARDREHEGLAVGREIAAERRLLVVDFFHRIDLVRSCSVDTWRRLARSLRIHGSTRRERCAQQCGSNQRFFHGLLLVQV